MIFIFETLATIATVFVLWSVSGLVLESAHNIFYEAFGSHFF